MRVRKTFFNFWDSGEYKSGLLNKKNNYMERNHFHLQMDCDTDYPYQITLKRKKLETWGNKFWIAVESFKVANDSILLILLVGKHSNKQVQKMEEILRSFEMERSMTKTENRQFLLCVKIKFSKKMMVILLLFLMKYRSTDIEQKV